MDDTDDDAKPAKPHHTGHRERLRNRFEEGGPDAMPDYELMELVLFTVLPRRDVKPLAKALIERFGSFAGVFGAEAARLREISGLGDTAITTLKVFQATATRIARGTVMNKPVLSHWSKLEEYLRVQLAHERVEQFRILFLDNKNRLIADEMQQKGTVNHTPVYAREVVRRTLELGACAIILVHNHPSGDPTPSRDDIGMTTRIMDAARSLGIKVHDHMIVGRQTIYSFRAEGLIS